MSSDGEYIKECVFPSLPRTTRGMPLVISESVDGTKFLYCNGNSVYIRNIECFKHVTDCDIYTEHSVLTTVAKYAPSGFYVASGDQSGKIRIWDTTQATHILKAEYPVISGPIRDIAWSEDSKRIAAVGEGRERFGHVFLFDTGTSNGNLSGQSRPVSSVDFRPSRPYRLVSASEDNTVAIFEGPPFKFKTLFHEHTRFVHCVRYNKSGTHFASGGADGKVVLFDGESGEKVGEFLDDNCKNAAHDGGVFGLVWAADSSKIATASGDKTVKIWNVGERKLIGTIKFGTTIDDQQLSLVWTKKWIISVALNGFINYIDAETNTVARVLRGHNKPITALTLTANRRFAFTADFEGNICRWKIENGECERLVPMVHKSQVSSLAVAGEDVLVSTAWDDTIAFTNSVTNTTDGVKPATQKLSSQPRGVAALPDMSVVAIACHKSVIVYEFQKLKHMLNVSYEGTCVDVHPTNKKIAVGGQDGKVRIYDLSDALTEKKVLVHAGTITALKFSPDGKYLVVTDVARKVVPYELDADFKSCSAKEWTFHTARINCCAWSANSRYVATGSLDTNIIVWDLQNSGEHPLIIKGAHAMSPINGIAWLSDKRLISAGQDSNIKQWTLNI